MNHLEGAKTLLTAIPKAEDAKEAIGITVAYALIAIAESSHVRTEALIALNSECRKIAEQLEIFVKNDAARWDREVMVIPGSDGEDK